MKLFWKSDILIRTSWIMSYHGT